jgi:hypothetical protein
MHNPTKNRLLGSLAVLLVALLCAPSATSQDSARAQQPTKDQKERHNGVLVSGHGTAAFEPILMDVFDILGERGVAVANKGLERIDAQRVQGFMPLPELIDMLPRVGADSLLYVKVTPGMTDRAATVIFQCFGANGQIIWEEKANDVLVDGGNTMFHPNGWKKRLAAHIGKPGLALK